MDFNDYWIYRYFKGGLWYKVETYGWLDYNEYMDWILRGVLLIVVKTEKY